MKKSNKLLLLTGLLPMIILGLIHLNLYARYKAGNFVSREVIHAERYERKTFPRPVYLSVRGVSNITVVPSDSCAVEYEKRPGGDMDKQRIDVKPIGGSEDPVIPNNLYYLWSGDTLNIYGLDSMVSSKKRTVLGVPAITLFCRGIRTMEFNDSRVVIRQEKGVTPVNSSLLILNNSNCSLADLQYNPDTTRCMYDSLGIRETKSYMALNPYAIIRNLRVELDSFSTFDDVSAKIENPFIQFNDGSKLHVKGAVIRKLPSK